MTVDTRTATPVHHTDTTDAGSWDASANLTRVNWPTDTSTGNALAAYLDDDAFDDDGQVTRAAVKLPHHEVSADGTPGAAHLAGVRNALSRLPQSDIPESEWDAVREHLNAHLDDAGGEDDTEQNRRDWFSIDVREQGDSDSESVAVISLFDVIDSWGGWWGVSANDFLDQVRDLTVDRIELHINSPGGEVFEGIAIANVLAAHPAKVDVVVDGLAASIASLIAVSGDTLTMAPRSMMMIHKAWTLEVGDEDAMRHQADVLAKIDSNIAAAYADKSGRAQAEFTDMMRAETWFTAAEAVENGLADSVAVVDGGMDNDPEARRRWAEDVVRRSRPASPRAARGEPSTLELRKRGSEDLPASGGPVNPSEPSFLGHARSVSTLRSIKVPPLSNRDRRRLPDQVLARLRESYGEQAVAERHSGFDIDYRGRVLEHRATRRVELRRDDDGNPVIHGYATVYDAPYDLFGGPDYGGFVESIAAGATAKSVREQDDVFLFFDHTGLPLARTAAGTLTLASDKVGLFNEAYPDPGSPWSMEVLSRLERGELDAMSFAFEVIRQSWNRDYTERRIEEVKLFDVSVVSFPANPATVAAARGTDPDPSSAPTGRGMSLALARAQRDRLTI